MGWFENRIWSMDSSRKWAHRWCVSAQIPLLSHPDPDALIPLCSAFLPQNERRLVSLSLGGELTCFEIPDVWSPRAEATKQWNVPAKQIVKATTIVAENNCVLICGVSSKARGIMELLTLPA
ncbi:hypothetical protein FRB91_001500 [Serendipita sp. 411]|nr:hypothetical protein FRC18_003335 [Serendipita sp. 400]KAG8845770.1 hypothetical protein FRB91_001500 [Serendipita sp. 411]KAG9043038.1 hypothetical protein FS842_001938 [Serendipita sp. 407]